MICNFYSENHFTIILSHGMFVLDYFQMGFRRTQVKFKNKIYFNKTFCTKRNKIMKHRNSDKNNKRRHSVKKP